MGSDLEGRSEAELVEAVHANTGACRLGQEQKPVARWEVETLQDALDLSGLMESALALYDRVIDTTIVWFREVATVAGAVFYLACRRAQCPVTLRAIGQHGHSTKLKLGRLVTDLQRELDLVVLPPAPEVFLPEIRARLELPERVESLAVALLEEVREAEPSVASGRSPAGVAAGMLYTACREYTDHHPTQHDVADAADACITTIRDIYQLTRPIIRPEP